MPWPFKDPDPVPETISDTRWDHIVSAADKSLEDRPDGGAEWAKTANLLDRNSRWN